MSSSMVGTVETIVQSDDRHLASRRLLRGQPGALAMLGPGETLPLTINLAFRRETA